MDDTQRTGWQKRILLFLTSQCITLFGSTLVQMAIVWYATMQTASGVWVAAFTVGSYLPQFLISFIGGVWADRYHRKKLIIGADMLIAFATFIMVLAIPHISSEPALLGGLLVMSVVRSFGAGIQTPAVNAVIPQLVPAQQLMRYNGINATMQSVVNFAAPAAAGAVFAVSTLRTTLMIDIVTAVLGTGLLSCLVLPKQDTSFEKSGVLSDMKIGVRYAFSDRGIGKLLIIYGLFTFFCVPAGYLAGLLVRRGIRGYLLVSYGSRSRGVRGHDGGRSRYEYMGRLPEPGKDFSGRAFGVWFLCDRYGLFKEFYSLSWIDGVLRSCIDNGADRDYHDAAGENRYLYARACLWLTDAALDCRVFGLLGTMYAGFLPLGMAVFGPLADILPLQWIMIGSGIALILIAVITYFHQVLKGVN